MLVYIRVLFLVCLDWTVVKAQLAVSNVVHVLCVLNRRHRLLLNLLELVLALLPLSAIDYRLYSLLVYCLHLLLSHQMLLGICLHQGWALPSVLELDSVGLLPR